MDGESLFRLLIVVWLATALILTLRSQRHPQHRAGFILVAVYLQILAIIAPPQGLEVMIGVVVVLAFINATYLMVGRRAAK